MSRILFLTLLLLPALASCSRSPAPPDAPVAPLSDEEVRATPPQQKKPDSWDPPAAPAGVPSGAGTPYADSMAQASAAGAAKKASVRYRNGKLVSDGTAPVIQVVSEFDNYRDGKVAVPAYPGDVLYLGVNAQTEAGTPLKRKPVEIRSARNTRVVLMSEMTDDQGYLEFHMVAGAVGNDMVTVTAGGASTDFYIDVTEPPRGEWLAGVDLKGVTPWDLLMSAQVEVGLKSVSAAFPKPLQDLQNRRLRLVGFMLPLGVEEKQKHFLLSANPPSCFFHPPGGPSSVVEVFADKGIAMSYDPLVVEGQFELVDRSDGGILYKLKSTKLVASGS